MFTNCVDYKFMRSNANQLRLPASSVVRERVQQVTMFDLLLDIPPHTSDSIIGPLSKLNKSLFYNNVCHTVGYVVTYKTNHTHSQDMWSSTIKTARQWLDHWSHWTAAPFVDRIQHSNGFSLWVWCNLILPSSQPT